MASTCRAAASTGHRPQVPLPGAASPGDPVICPPRLVSAGTGGKCEQSPCPQIWFLPSPLVSVEPALGWGAELEGSELAELQPAPFEAAPARPSLPGASGFILSPWRRMRRRNPAGFSVSRAGGVRGGTRRWPRTQGSWGFLRALLATIPLCSVVSSSFLI